ncbi:hypothetical protein ANCDUO_13036 [Ancylostoma duodenale]|uniref:Uncharacterized protein n=1 Tax=Ancylostoma duodenale TaxID=51022 RepID=A0A0C2D419_9BILA|nr:hypothetical protein ANCDUO_13036 [Ancylostoma duodenale]
MVSVKDFVWVYDVKPTRQAMENPENTLAMSRSCGIRIRAHQQEEPIYGIVLSITKRRDQVTAFRAAFEGAPEAVTVTQSICDFPLSDMQEDDFVLADSRYNVSCSMRFSEPPVSFEARDHLCQVVRQFLPMHPGEGLLPLRVHALPEEEKQWLTDRAGKFDSYYEDNEASKRKITKVFNAACSALASFNSTMDDHRTH